MSEAVRMTDVEAARLSWVETHKSEYLGSGGAQGHIVDLRVIGGLQFTTTLLLKTLGRKTGKVLVTPLIYGDTGGEIVIVASKGGADVDPAWYLNLKSADEVLVQVATQAFRATWREPAGEQRSHVWQFMERLYPPYTEYRKATLRDIPLIMLQIIEATTTLEP